MSHDLKLALVLYGLSCVPWILALILKPKDRSTQWGFALVDGVLTYASYLYFAYALGWWAVLVIVSNVGLGLIIKDTPLDAYDNLFSKN